MKRPAQHRSTTNPGDFFTHLIRQNKDVKLAKESVLGASREKKVLVKPLKVGDMVKLCNALCRAVRVSAARSDIEHPDDYEMGESNERTLVCRGLVMLGR